MNGLNDWLIASDDKVLLRCYAQPGASKNEVAGPHGDRLKIRIKAPPVEGKANKELIKFLSKLLKLPKSKLNFVRGESSRQKDILLEGADIETIRQLLS